jgi:hypothetical protein
MLTTLLGLDPDAFGKRLRVVRPLLPEFVNRLEIRKLAVGSASVDLRFRRSASNVVVDILRVDGDLDVSVEQEAGDAKPSPSPTPPSPTSRAKR